MGINSIPWGPYLIAQVLEWSYPGRAQTASTLWPVESVLMTSLSGNCINLDKGCSN
jgi:hypothetical protein